MFGWKSESLGSAKKYDELVIDDGLLDDSDSSDDVEEEEDCDIEEEKENDENILLKIDPPAPLITLDPSSLAISFDFDNDSPPLPNCGPSSKILGYSVIILNRILFSILAKGRT